MAITMNDEIALQEVISCMWETMGAKSRAMSFEWLKQCEVEAHESKFSSEEFRSLAQEALRTAQEFFARRWE